MEVKWALTVRALITSSPAIWASESPCAIRRSTSTSRAESLSGYSRVCACFLPEADPTAKETEPGNGPLVVSLCLGNLSLSTEQAAQSIAIPCFARQSQSLCAQGGCLCLVLLKPGEIGQIDQGPVQHDSVARPACEGQIFLYQSFCACVVATGNGERGQVSACSRHESRLLVNLD